MGNWERETDRQCPSCGMFVTPIHAGCPSCDAEWGRPWEVLADE